MKVTFHAGAWGTDHLFQALNAITATGIRFVEVYADVATVYDGKADEFRFFLEKAGLSLAGAYGGGVFTDEDFREVDVEGARATARWLRQAGGDLLILQGGEPSDDPERDLRVAAETADAVGKACLQEKIRFCYQPHIGSVFFTEEQIRALLDATDPRLVHLCLATGHMSEAKVDLVPFIADYIDRIRIVHLRDLRMKPIFVGGPFANAGKGTVPLPAIIGALKSQEYAGWLVGFADDARIDPAQSARDFADYATQKLRILL